MGDVMQVKTPCGITYWRCEYPLHDDLVTLKSVSGDKMKAVNQLYTFVKSIGKDVEFVVYDVEDDEYITEEDLV